MTPTTAITRFELGSTFEEFNLAMNKANFIGASVFRPLAVGQASASIGKVPVSQLLANNVSTKRNAGAGYARDTFEFDKWAYAVQEFGKEEPLDDSQVAMYGDIIDAERIAVDRAEASVLNEYERDCATLAQNTGVISTVAASALWTSPSTADIIGDVQGAAGEVEDATGLQANALVISTALWRAMIRSDEIIDMIKPTQLPGANAVRGALAELLGIKYIFVAGGMTNTAKEGQAAAISRIWDKTKALVCRVAESNDPKEPCIGRTFIFTGDGPGAPGDGGTLAVVAEEYREEKVRGTVYRARNNRDIQVMYAAAGKIITGVAA